jgi:hypothetical protein
VAFVVPNLIDDMHDGSVAVGAAWLKANIDAYAQCAKTHNSLLILTLMKTIPRLRLVPTIMVGAGIVPGTYNEPINHYSILATVESIFWIARSDLDDASSTCFPGRLFQNVDRAPGALGAGRRLPCRYHEVHGGRLRHIIRAEEALPTMDGRPPQAAGRCLRRSMAQPEPT